MRVISAGKRGFLVANSAKLIILAGLDQSTGTSRGGVGESSSEKSVRSEVGVSMIGVPVTIERSFGV